MDQEQLDYLLQSQYLPSTRDLNIGSMGVTPVLLQGTGLQTGTMGANPQLMTDDSLQVGSMGTNPQLMTDQFLQLGSMGANPFRGIQTVFRPNTPPALSDLGGITPNFGIAEEEDEEQVDYLGSKPSRFKEGIAKLFEFFQRISPIAAIGRGLESLRNRFDTRKAIKDDIIRDRQGTIDTIISPRIMNIQPTDQDIARGGGNIPTKTTSRRTSPQGGMQAERTRSRDLGRMRGGVGR